MIVVAFSSHCLDNTNGGDFEFHLLWNQYAKNRNKEGSALLAIAMKFLKVI